MALTVGPSARRCACIFNTFVCFSDVDESTNCDNY